MKNLWICILGIITFIFGDFSYANDYEYKELDIKADVKIDGTIDVTETFTTNFFKKKHGIIRFIPLDYTVENADFHIDLDYIRVDGNKFSTYIDDGGMNIKIGDPDIEIKGEKVYPISYSVYGLIRNFAGMGYTELYRNIVGYDFDTNIDSVVAEINLPKKYNGLKRSDFMITVDGKDNTVDQFEGDIDWSLGNKISIKYDKKLKAGEGITLAIKFPKDYFEFDHDKQASLIGKSSYSSGNSNSTFSSIFMDKFMLFMSYVANLIVGLLGGAVVVFVLAIFSKMGLIKQSNNDSNNTVTYDRNKGFSGGSVFSGGGKLFKKGGGGGGGGSRSW